MEAARIRRSDADVGGFRLRHGARRVEHKSLARGLRRKVGGRISRHLLQAVVEGVPVFVDELEDRPGVDAVRFSRIADVPQLGGVSAGKALELPGNPWIEVFGGDDGPEVSGRKFLRARYKQFKYYQSR